LEEAGQGRSKIHHYSCKPREIKQMMGIGLRAPRSSTDSSQIILSTHYLFLVMLHRHWNFQISRIEVILLEATQ